MTEEEKQEVDELIQQWIVEQLCDCGKVWGDRLLVQPPCPIHGTKRPF